MPEIYPASPPDIPDQLTQASPGYRIKAWLALLVLAGFVLLYLGLTSWFCWTSYRLFLPLFKGGSTSFVSIVVAICAAFFGFFMLKGLLSVRHSGKREGIEVTAQQEPTLFRFLERLASEAGAPKPHRVFLSARVNASVSYDLSIVNLLFPTRKNLEIGLGLVNVLTLSELKAVLAHEFGHFAQRSMAVGRWVYIAEQIASNIVAQRDAFDHFLNSLRRSDIRVAWVGMLLSLVVWSIRSVLDSAFRLVTLAQRALSREMEMQADLVAVALTGSDDLVHALYKTASAEDAWERAIAFANGEIGRGRATRDLFAVQARVIQHMRVILNSPVYGKLPPMKKAPEQHRVFKVDLAQPSQMWSTHPLNHEREENAKRIYIPSPHDSRSAWSLFADANARREQLTDLLTHNATDLPPKASLEQSLQALDVQYRRLFLNRFYRGAYLGRSVVRFARQASDLYGPSLETALADLAGLYPESLARDLDKLRRLERECAQLEALRDGFLSAPGGTIRHGGKTLQRRDLPKAIESLRKAKDRVQQRIWDHDRRVRTAHRAAARRLGHGWEAYLVGLLSVLHYADHSDANLTDARGLLANVVSVVTVSGSVNKKGRARVLACAREVYAALCSIYGHRQQVRLDSQLLKRMDLESWDKALGELQLIAPDAYNLGDWLQVIDQWVNTTSNALSTLRTATLEELLTTEALVAKALHDQQAIAPAPAPSQVPGDFPTLLPGDERERQTRLDWWSRFQTADGTWATFARTAVACSIVGIVLGFGDSVGNNQVYLYNGLTRPVIVQIDAQQAELSAGQMTLLELKTNRAVQISTRTLEGHPIEQFEAPLEAGNNHYVYNVAAASPLIEWTASYGTTTETAPRQLGAPRWTTTSVDFPFVQPPDSIQTKQGGTTRTVLSGMADASPAAMLDTLKNTDDQARLIATRARWDDIRTPNTLYWLQRASELPQFESLMRSRLREQPAEIPTWRMLQDLLPTRQRQAICQEHQTRAQANPQHAGWHYLTARCLPDAALRDATFIDGATRWPQHGWFSYAAGGVLAERGDWQAALPLLERAATQEPALADYAAVAAARVRRAMLGESAPLADLAHHSRELQGLLRLESGSLEPANPWRAISQLKDGKLTEALATAANTEQLEAMVIRLAAASEGSSPLLLNKALQLPINQGITAQTLWPAYALALRHQANVAHFKPLLARMRGEEPGRLLQFVEALTGQPDLALANRLLQNLPPELRGQAASMGLILLGDAAPAAWRTEARRLLFASERPYFRDTSTATPP